MVLVTTFFPLFSKQFLVLNPNLYFLIGIAILCIFDQFLKISANEEEILPY